MEHEEVVNYFKKIAELVYFFEGNFHKDYSKTRHGRK